MLVTDIMTKDVVSVSPETPVAEVARLMVKHDMSGLPVLDGDRLVGLVTELDLIAQHAEPDAPSMTAFFGGFITLGANLAAQTAAVSPQSLVFVPQIGQLAVVDGAAEGLVLVSLDSVAVSRLFF